MESIENQIEQLSRGSADAKEVAAVKDDAYKERLTTIERSMRDISRNVQLVRDRQVINTVSSQHAGDAESPCHLRQLHSKACILQELAGAQAELAAHLSTQVNLSCLPNCDLAHHSAG